VPLMAAQEPSLIAGIEDRGHKRMAGNRFGRVIDDLPLAGRGLGPDERRAIVDVLAPARTSRPRSTRRIGKQLVTTEVPGSLRRSVDQRPSSTLSSHDSTGRPLTYTTRSQTSSQRLSSR
jgi:hypothetical protein